MYESFLAVYIVVPCVNTAARFSCGMTMTRKGDNPLCPELVAVPGGQAPTKVITGQTAVNKCAPIRYIIPINDML